jgi:HSP20 family protein
VDASALFFAADSLLEEFIMANALRELGRGLNQAWGTVAEGWRELARRSSSALTRFFPPRKGASQPGIAPGAGGFPEWGMLAGEVIETDRSVVVNVELPGIAREDCEVRIEEDALIIRGEKRMDREHIGDSYYVMERAYGSFQRVVPLPPGTDPDSAQATYRDGVLRIELPRNVRARRRISVT